MNQFNKVILAIIFFIVSSVFPFYHLCYFPNSFITTFIFSIWVSMTTIALTYVIEDKRKLLFVVGFWIVIFILCYMYEIYGWKIIDPVLYGWVYCSFFFMCGSILYKFDIRFHDRLELILCGYLFQGIYDWVWWIYDNIDVTTPMVFTFDTPFYVDLVIKDCLVIHIFIIEIINVILALIALFVFKRKNWNFTFAIFLWIILQLTTIVLSYFEIEFPYIALYVIYGTIYAFYVFIKYFKKINIGELLWKDGNYL